MNDHPPIWYAERCLFAWTTLASGIVGALTFGFLIPNWDMKIALWWARRQASRHQLGRRP